MSNMYFSVMWFFQWLYLIAHLAFYGQLVAQTRFENSKVVKRFSSPLLEQRLRLTEL